MFSSIIGSSSRRNIERIAESMPSELASRPDIDAITRFRIQSMKDECKQRSEDRKKYLE